MSTGAKVFQLIFVVLGLLFIGFGLLGVISSGGQQASSAVWICKPDEISSTSTKCTSVGSANRDLEGALGYLLVGIGLEATAAAIAAGSRLPARQGIPMPYPTMQSGGTTPMAPMASGQAQFAAMPTGPTSGGPSALSYPASSQRPPWSS
jgi:hypothetical protein